MKQIRYKYFTKTNISDMMKEKSEILYIKTRRFPILFQNYFANNANFDYNRCGKGKGGERDRETMS